MLFNKKNKFFLKKDVIRWVFLKKRFKNAKNVHKYKLKLVKTRGFYKYVSSFHLTSKSKHYIPLSKYVDYSQSRYWHKMSRLFRYYGDFFWMLVIIPFILFDLYWFKRIFKRWLSREKSSRIEKFFLKKQQQSVYNFKIKWSYIGWEYYDVNTLKSFQWWSVNHNSNNLWGFIQFIEEIQELVEWNYINMFDYRDSWSIWSLNDLNKQLFFSLDICYGKVFINREYHLGWGVDYGLNFFEMDQHNIFEISTFPHDLVIGVDFFFELFYTII